MYEYQKAYKEEFGHCHVRLFSHKHRQLGYWTRQMRRARRGSLAYLEKNPGLQVDDSIVLEGISEERINLLTSIGFVWEPSPYINIIPTRTTLEKRKRLMEWQAAHEKECEEYNEKQRRRQFSTVEDVHNRRNQLEGTFEFTLAFVTYSTNMRSLSME